MRSGIPRVGAPPQYPLLEEDENQPPQGPEGGGHDDLARRGITTRTAPTTRANGKGFSPHPRPCGIPRAFDGGRAKIGETRDTP